MNLAVVLFESGNAADAEYHFRIAVRIRPDYPLAHLNYGRMLRRQNRTAEAMEQLRSAADGKDPAVSRAARELMR